MAPRPVRGREAVTVATALSGPPALPVIVAERAPLHDAGSACSNLVLTQVRGCPKGGVGIAPRPHGPRAVAPPRPPRHETGMKNSFERARTIEFKNCTASNASQRRGGAMQKVPFGSWEGCLRSKGRAPRAAAAHRVDACAPAAIAPLRQVMQAAAWKGSREVDRVRRQGQMGRARPPRGL